jgi:hypothetical protein
MNFFTHKNSWSNLEFIPFKLCIAAPYVLVGAYFHDFFRLHYIPVLILFAISVTATLYLWIKKMKA